MANIYKSEAGERAVKERYSKFLARWPVPCQQMTVPTREGDTFIVASGPESGPPLLLFQGSGGNAAMWMGDVAAWAAHFRVFAVDLIGEPGLSAPSRPPLGSDAYALWLDDVMQALGLSRASLVGMSLGGWLALDYATRWPDRVERLVLLCPAGIGKQKIGALVKILPLLLLGNWGRRKARELVAGRVTANPSPAARVFADFVSLIFAHFRPRREKIPLLTDEALARLTMPVLLIVGGKDTFVDSEGSRRRLERHGSRVTVKYLPEAGHFLPSQTIPVLEFLRGSGGA